MGTTIREGTMAIERLYFSPLAILSADTKGRNRYEEDCPVRTPFQVDRDRIVHSKAFRRLKHKTQVFLAPEGDHYRTRLTHTLEVSQIARTIAKALRLNEDLTEAIALGHDLGHTPFGHAGERALGEVCPLGFKHYEQSVRVAEDLEKNGLGLNLTYEVKNGILRHTNGDLPETLEGQIVRISDRIAYINHDIEDSIRAGILKETDISKKILDRIGHTHSKRIDTLVSSVINNSTNVIMMSHEISEVFSELHDFMFEFVYFNKIAKAEEGKAKDVIKRLYEYFVANPESLPGELNQVLETEGIERAACDYIAGMTDQFALEKFKDIFIPKGWRD